MIRAIFTYHDGKTEILDRPAAMYRKHWSAVGVGYEQVQLADMVVLINLESGKTVVLKNRYGQTRGSLDELIADSELHEISAGERIRHKAERVSYVGTVEDQKRYLSGRAKVVFESKYKTKLPDIDLDVPAIPASHVLANKICRCEIADLMSTGHKDGCPEKKR